MNPLSALDAAPRTTTGYSGAPPPISWPSTSAGAATQTAPPGGPPKATRVYHISISCPQTLPSIACLLRRGIDQEKGWREKGEVWDYARPGCTCLVCLAMCSTSPRCGLLFIASGKTSSESGRLGSRSSETLLLTSRAELSSGSRTKPARGRAWLTGRGVSQRPPSIRGRRNLTGTARRVRPPCFLLRDSCCFLFSFADLSYGPPPCIFPVTWHPGGGWLKELIGGVGGRRSRSASSMRASSPDCQHRASSGSLSPSLSPLLSASTIDSCSLSRKCRWLPPLFSAHFCPSSSLPWPRLGD